MYRSSILWAFFLPFLFSVITSEEIYDGLVNTNVERNIDLTSQIAKYAITITLTNKGSKSVSNFHIALTEEKAQHLSILQAFDESGTKLQLTKVEAAHSHGDARYIEGTINTSTETIQIDPHLFLFSTVDLI